MVAAYENGKLEFPAGAEPSRETVLALPLSRMILKLVRVPGVDAKPEAERADYIVKTAAPVLEAMSPYPDEPLTISCEHVQDDVYIAAALPESSSDDIAAALDAAKTGVTRIDALVFGELRSLWNQVGGEGRKLLLLRSPDCISLLVIDGGLPVAIRAFGDGSDLKRETILSLLEAEDFGGVKPLGEIVVRGDIDVSPLERLAPVRRLETSGDTLAKALNGVEARSGEAGSIDILPESWRQVLTETRFKRKMVRYLALAGGLWAVAMAVLLGVPAAYGFMTDYQKGLSKSHQREYRAVSQMRDKVKLVRKYSDHARGALEIMKAVSDRLPQGVELNSWNYKREEGVRVSGEGTGGEAIYRFKDNMATMHDEDNEEPIFPSVNLKGPSSTKAGKYKFDLDCTYETEEE